MTAVTPDTAPSTARPDLLAGLAEVLEEVAGTPADQVIPSAGFDSDLDIDSLTMVEVVVACEERFGVRIPDEALEQLRTVGDAVTFIGNAGAAA
ncbi:MAG: acyl carrier protein [Actinomycetota bacterium]|nr:acyl carrier protein [Actinomycetota bacterium]